MRYLTHTTSVETRNSTSHSPKLANLRQKLVFVNRKSRTNSWQKVAEKHYLPHIYRQHRVVIQGRCIFNHIYTLEAHKTTVYEHLINQKNIGGHLPLFTTSWLRLMCSPYWRVPMRVRPRDFRTWLFSAPDGMSYLSRYTRTPLAKCVRTVGGNKDKYGIFA